MQFRKGMEKMTDAVQIILILCATYVVVTLINKWNPVRGKHEKEGGKK